MRDDLNKKDIEKYTLNQVLNLAFNVRRFRKENNLTQMEFAIMVDCSDSFVSKIERATYLEINLFTLNKLCFVMETSIDNILKK